MTLSRRQILKSMSAATLGAATMSTLGTALSGFQKANAATVSGYKALVCVFLFGGADSHDYLLPYDQSSYDSLKSIRAGLFNGYASQSGGNSRARNNLLKLNPTNASTFGGREFALPPEMSGLHTLFEEGNAAIVGNVGPLIRPLNRTQWENNSVATPKKLFSHNDQQSTWVSSAPEGATSGWGGRFADAAIASGANPTKAFTAITALGNELFLTGQNVSTYQIGFDGAPEIEILKTLEGTSVYNDARASFRAANFAGTNLIEQDLAEAAKTSIDLNESFNQARTNLTAFTTQFPGDDLGKQLKSIAETIAIRSSLNVSRQVFFAGIGGFDSHSNQVSRLPSRLNRVDQAITALYRSMQEIGLGSDVTIFTASDFGRTLTINGNGTDHGWGSHHFVVGSAVQGKQIYGQVPPPSLGHSQDSGHGRLIPTTSVEQFAEPLGRWFGLNNTELNNALPNLSNFSSQKDLKNILKS